jgi:hypothetical protein
MPGIGNKISACDEEATGYTAFSTFGLREED